MVAYEKIGSKFERKYGKTISVMAEELGFSRSTIFKWDRSGFDIFEKAERERFLLDHKKIGKLICNMRARCGNPNDGKYKYYGGRGIKVKMGLDDLIFLWKRDKADQMKRPSIDRINSDGHYELKNCRFVEMGDNKRRSLVKKLTRKN